MTRFLLIGACVLLTLARAADEPYVARDFTDAAGTKLPYRLLPPPTDLRAGTRVPLVLFLHGAGERGDDNARQLTWGGTLWTEPVNRKRFPCAVVFPQCPGDQRWVETDWGRPTPEPMAEQPGRALAAALALVDQLVKQLPIDRSRIYVVGLSMGGYGTWEAIARRPELFAAGIPMCGGGAPATAAKFAASVPVWAFHGDADPIVPVVRSRLMVEALKNAGGRPRYSECPGVGHEVWQKALADPELLPWLFAQHRAAKPAASHR